jgi:hypothetical protein
MSTSNPALPLAPHYCADSPDPENPTLYPGNRTFTRQQRWVQEFSEAAIQIDLLQPDGNCEGVMLTSRAIFTWKTPVPRKPKIHGH